MTEREQHRLVNHRLAVLRHAEEVTGNVAQTCRYFGISGDSSFPCHGVIDYGLWIVHSQFHAVRRQLDGT